MDIPNLNDFAHEIYLQNRAKGFWNTRIDLVEKIKDANCLELDEVDESEKL